VLRSIALLLCGPLLSAAPTHVVGQADALRHPGTAAPLYMIIRTDDAGKSLNRNPQVSVGIHPTLNSEWKNCRCGPVLGRTAVPSLVDADGYFFSSSQRFRDALKAHNVQLLTYRQLIAMQGLGSMHRPQG
jgi:hypothetical protein